jgi:hypothetical protein
MQDQVAYAGQAVERAWFVKVGAKRCHAQFAQFAIPRIGTDRGVDAVMPD